MLKWLWRILIAVAVLLLAFRVADRVARRGAALPPLPEPNAYDTLLAAAHSATQPPSDIAGLSPDAIQRLVQTNQSHLDQVHAAIRTNSGVPLRTETSWGEKHTADLRQLKQLAVLLGLQSRAHHLQGRTNQAAAAMLDTVLLGQTLARGGLLVDGLTALAIETVGAASLRSQVPQLDAATCRSLAQELAQHEQRREPPERILATEKAWSAASFGLVSRLGGLVLRKAETQRHAQFVSRYHDTTRNTRRLILALAARAVELETGTTVTHSSALVPAVLQSIPADPTTGNPITEIPGGR